MRSLAGYIFPYIRSLELRIESLDTERRQLLDRILVLTTNDPLVPRPPDPPLTPEQRKAVRDKVDEISEVNSYPTFTELLQAAEAQSFHESAEDITGREEIVEGADVINSYEASTEEDRVSVGQRRKKMQQAVARAVTEYKTNVKPVEMNS